MTYGLAIVGAGKVGAIHAKAACDAGVPPRMIVDADASRAQRLAAQCRANTTQAATTVDEALNRKDIDAIVVAVPTALHKPVTRAALDAGKDVLLEKPMGRDVAECDAIVNAAHKHPDRIVQLAFVCRYAPVALKARQLIEQGALGDIYHIKASLYRQRGIPGLGGWFTTREQSGGGELADLGVHFLDLIMHLTNRRDVHAVSASCVSTFGWPIENYRYEEMWGGPPKLDGVFDVEDGASGLIRFGRDMTMELNVMWASNLPNGVLPDGIAILGDRGGLWMELWTNRLILTTQRAQRVVDEPQSVDSTNAWDEAWQRQHEVFADLTRSRSQPTATVEHGRHVQAVVEAMYHSSDANREIRMDTLDSHKRHGPLEAGHAGAR